MKSEKVKIVRPEVEIEYKGFRGMIYALFAIVKVGIKVRRCTLDMVLKGFDEPLETLKFILVIIPKYKIIKGA